MVQARYFEQVSAGDEIPQLAKGPLSTTHLMRWSAAMENWHKIHYDLPFTLEREKLPGLLVNGTFKQQFIVQCLRDWVTPHGWVWKASFQYRAMNLAGETLTAWGRVKERSETPEYGLVELDIGLINEAGKESTPGTAIVALPYREGLAIPYPFVPPQS